MRKRKNTFKAWVALALVSVLPFLYNNCTNSHSPGSASSNSLSVFKSCSEATELTLYARSYYPLLKNKCAKCHYGAGEGPGAFASSELQPAFESFLTIGSNTIKDRALDGHSSGSGAQNTEAIKTSENQWHNGVEFMRNCSLDLNAELLENQDSPDRIQLRSKPLLFEKGIEREYIQSTTLEWDLSNPNEVLMNPENNKDQDDRFHFKNSDFNETDGTEPTKVQVDVSLYFTGSKLVYSISRPRVVSTTKSVHINSILFKMNGRAQPAQRAFFFAGKDVRAWNDGHPLKISSPDYVRDREDFLPEGLDWASASDAQRNQALVDQAATEAADKLSSETVSNATLVVDAEVRTTDVISLSIGDLYYRDLPPPGQLPIVSISAVEEAGMVTSTGVDDYELSREDNIPDPLTCGTPNCARSPGEYSTFAVRVALDRTGAADFDDISSVDIVMGADNTAKDECCEASSNYESNEIRHDKFDRDIEQLNRFDQSVRGNDYRVGYDDDGVSTGTRWRIRFFPGETEKLVYFRVQPDKQNEGAGETLHFRLRSASLMRFAEDAGENRLNEEIKILIPDNDTEPYSPLGAFYQNLMKPGGKLRDNCVRCHNSVDKRGGYDMTDYWDMVQREVLVRGGGVISEGSMMFLRTGPTDAGQEEIEGLPIMPPPTSEGAPPFTSDDVEDIAEWLRDGAENN